MGRHRREPKTCPKCGLLHQKRSRFCSRSCGNARQHGQDVLQRQAASLRAYYLTPAGLEHRETLSSTISTQLASNGMITKLDDWMVVPPADAEPFADWDVNSY